MTTRPTDSSLANPPRGVLHPDFSATHYDLTRTLPPPTLAPFVELFWVVKWDLRERPPHLQQNFPHPCVHLVVESGNTRVLGLVKGRFVRQLQGKGRIVGAKFKPGGFHPFVAGSVSKLTQRQWALRRIFGVDNWVRAYSYFTYFTEDLDVCLLGTCTRLALPIVVCNIASLQR